MESTDLRLVFCRWQYGSIISDFYTASAENKRYTVKYTGNAPFQPCILLRITRYNDYVMRPRSYNRGLRNRKTYANANANAKY